MVRRRASAVSNHEAADGMIMIRSRQYALLPPHLIGDLDREPELGPLLVFGENVALLRGRETALRRQRELFQRHELGSLVQSALDVVLVLQFAEFRGDD